jgi:hypothetical protein
VAGAKPENRRRVFELQSRDLMAYVREGLADHAEIIDALQAMAEEFGLVAQVGQDEVQRIMADAADADPLPDAEAPPLDATEPKKKVKGFPFTTYKAAKDGPVSKQWIFKGLLARGETSGWVGPPGSLKSAILASVTLAAASGQDWCGKRNKGSCAVIYFALERADLVKRRLRVYAEESGWNDLPIAVVAQTINFMGEKVVDEIVATIDNVEIEFGKKVGLLIVDTLPKGIAAGGGDEDKARDQGKVYANIQRVKDRRGQDAPHVALVCHPGKDVSRGPRGSNASTGDFDVQIEISGAGTRTATISKVNDGPEGYLASFRPKVHTFGIDEDGEPIEVCLAEPVTAAAPEPTKDKAKTWAKSLVLLRRILMRMIDELGRVLRPYPDGPPVRAVDTKVVRAEFYKEHPVDTDNTHDQQQEARRKAFNRALKSAQDSSLINIREIDGIQFVWFT